MPSLKKLLAGVADEWQAQRCLIKLQRAGLIGLVRDVLLIETGLAHGRWQAAGGRLWVCLDWGPR